MSWPSYKPYFTLLIPLIIGIFILGYQVDQSDFIWIWGSFSLSFGVYGLILLFALDSEMSFWLTSAFLLRLILLFGIPTLSDDIYRFIWDGHLLNHGINPFDHLPGYYLTAGNEIPGLSQELFSQLNSPNYFTIYPPVAQATFALATWLSPNSWWGCSLILKLIIFLAEVGNAFLLILLLKTFNFQIRNSLLYLLNPLIIIELTGNLHFEGVMVFFLLLAFWIIVKWGKLAIAGIAFAAAIASKLLPLMFLPFFIKRFGWKRAILFFGIIGLALILFFFPLFNEAFLGSMSSSLDLYFRKFEFNASFYYLLRWIGFQIVGYNLIQYIGPGLALITFCAILWYAFKEREVNWKSLPIAMLFAICTYLFCTTTVHPWYLALPIAFTCFTSFRFTLFWSYLITLTYINYSYPEYHENLWIVMLEYLTVGIILIWELFISKNKIRSAR